MKKLIAIILMFLFMGCAGTTNFKEYKPNEIKFDETPIYELSEKLKKPDAPKLIYLNEKFQQTNDKSKAKYVAMSDKEFKKIVALNKLYNTQEELLEKQEDLINTHIATINALKELIELKNIESEQYYKLWKNAEQAYQQERQQHLISNIINRTVTVLLAAGIVIIAL